MKSLKEKISHLEAVEDRLAALKDSCKDKTAYLITCGPSLTTHNRDELLKKLDGKLVIACKQAYTYVREVATFHLLSVYNYQDYDYYSEDTIRHWQLTAMNMPNEVERIQNWNQRMDIALPCYSTPWVQKHQSTSYTREFKNWEMYGDGKLVWGPGIMYESGFPLALHLGVSKIVTIGWDIGDLSKYGDGKMAVDDNWLDQHATDLYKADVGGGPEREELENTIGCTDKMYEYFLDRKVEVHILSNTNPADERFKRTILEEI